MTSQKVVNNPLGNYQVLVDRNARAEQQQVVRVPLGGAQGFAYAGGTTVLTGSTVDRLLVNNSPNTIFPGMIVRIESGVSIIYQEREIQSVSITAPFSIIPTMPFTAIPSIGAILSYRKPVGLETDSNGALITSIVGNVTVTADINPKSLILPFPEQTLDYSQFTNYFQGLLTSDFSSCISAFFSNQTDSDILFTNDGVNVWRRFGAGTISEIGGSAFALFSQPVSNTSCGLGYDTSGDSPTTGNFRVYAEQEN